MTGFETASLVIAAANAGAAVTAAAGIWYGIRAMIRANKDRAGLLDRQREADERRHAEAMRCHDEAMRCHDEAMQAADQRHAEAMQAGDQRHAEAMAAFERQGAALDELIRASQRQGEALERQGAALERQGAALETVIERTAPKPAPAAPAE